MNTYVVNNKMQGVQRKAQRSSSEIAPRIRTASSQSLASVRNKNTTINIQQAGRVAAMTAETISTTKVALTFLAISVALYLYMVVSIVVATVERKSLEELAREQTTELSFRETDFSQKVGDITIASAYDAGFVSADSQFTKKISATALTFNQ